MVGIGAGIAVTHLRVERGLHGLMLALLLLCLPHGAAMAVDVVPDVPPEPDDIIVLPDELRDRFRKEVLAVTTDPDARLERLVKFVFDAKGLGMTYKPDATLTISEAYRSRTLNCLTSTLLVMVLAREAGLHAEGQLVSSIVAWGATDETAIQTQHANAIITIRPGRRFIVDVDASDTPAGGVLNPVDDEKLIAYFYGNRAMEMMVEGRHQQAIAWMTVALRHSPEDAAMLNNYGVLNLREGNMSAAEALFRQSVSRDPSLLSGLSNLVALFQRSGDSDQEEYWRDRSEKLLRKAPYFQYQQGRRHELAGEWGEAAKFFMRAARLNPMEHRFHFALARVYFETGQLVKASRELSKALALSDGGQAERYQAKLAALHRMRH